MDRDKVIKALELCIADIECTDCPYEEECFSMDCEQYAEPMMRDALAMLKEQEKALYELGQLLKERAEEIERLKTPTAGDNKIPLKW